MQEPSAELEAKAIARAVKAGDAAANSQQARQQAGNCYPGAAMTSTLWRQWLSWSRHLQPGSVSLKSAKEKDLPK
jgi:hypothetical protein